MKMNDTNQMVFTAIEIRICEVLMFLKSAPMSHRQKVNQK